MSELELIQRFTRPFRSRSGGVTLGIGDDCAVLRLPRGQELAVTTDAVVEGVHFTRAFLPEEIGHKALAANLSDLAAMGASPFAFVCAIELPEARIADVPALARGMAKLARRTGIPLVGGNFTRSSALAVTITAMGIVPIGKALRRAGGRSGDALYVSGVLGGAASGLRRGASPALRRRQRRPEPRLALGTAALRWASAAIDVSDGLLRDLGHLALASGVSAVIDARAVPLQRGANVEDALTGGEDYELLLAVPPKSEPALRAIARQTRTPLTRIGHLESGVAGAIRDRSTGESMIPAGHDHFDDRGLGRTLR